LGADPDLFAKSPAGTQQAHREGGPAASQGPCRIGSVEPLPGHQPQHLLVGWRQPSNAAAISSRPATLSAWSSIRELSGSLAIRVTSRQPRRCPRISLAST